MRVLYISQYFAPERNAPANRVAGFAEAWCAAGHEVTIIAPFPTHPHGRKAPGDRRVIFRRENHQGAEVIRIWSYTAANKGVVRRCLSFLSFFLSSVLTAVFLSRRFDVTIATSPQLLVGLAGRIASIVLGTRFIFEVRDLWPEGLTEMGMRGGRLLSFFLRPVADFLYEAADEIVVPDACYRDAIRARYRVPSAKFRIVPSGVDMVLMRRSPEARAEIRERHGWGEGEIVVMYLGNFGEGQALERLIPFIRKALEQEMPARFVLIGDGPRKDEVVAEFQRAGLSGVEILAPVPREAVPRYYSAADVALVVLKDISLFEQVVPSKTVEILATSLPVLALAGGAVAELLRVSGAGIAVSGNDVDRFVEHLRKFASDAALRSQLGMQGRRFVEDRYLLERIADRYAAMLEVGLGIRPERSQAVNE